MNDVELLELAAKAAGYEKDYQWNVRFLLSAGGSVKINNAWHKWNPLEDHNDALNLVEKLKLAVNWRWSILTGKIVAVVVEKVGTRNTRVTEYFENGESVALRRAIVKSAAAIGEQIE